MTVDREANPESPREIIANAVFDDWTAEADEHNVDRIIAALAAEGYEITKLEQVLDAKWSEDEGTVKLWGWDYNDEWREGDPTVPLYRKV